MKRNLIYLVLALALLFLFPISSSISKLGERCQFSRDCQEGYCIDGTCKIPSVLEKYYTAGKCNSTMDCVNGFCYQSECIIPARDPEIIPIGAGVSNSCAGIIENCTGFVCMFCNVTWVILLLIAFLAAFISRKKGRLTPIILFAIPVLAGIIFFPFIGAIIAILELIMLAFVKYSLFKIAMEEISSIIKIRKEKEILTQEKEAAETKETQLRTETEKPEQ